MARRREWNEIVGVGRGFVVSAGPKPPRCSTRFTMHALRCLLLTMLLVIVALTLTFMTEPALFWGLLRSGVTILSR